MLMLASNWPKTGGGKGREKGGWERKRREKEKGGKRKKSKREKAKRKYNENKIIQTVLVIGKNSKIRGKKKPWG